MRIPLLLLAADIFQPNSFTMATAMIAFEALLIVILVVCIIRRQAINKELYNNRQKLHITLSTISDAIIYTDPQGKILEMNVAAEALTGWQLADAVGQPLPRVARLVNEVNRTPMAFPLEEILNNGKTVALKDGAVLMAKNGQEHHITNNNALVIGKGKQPIGIVMVFRDISMQDELEKQFRQSQKMEVTGKLTGSIAHDFGNVLQVILGYTQVLSKRITDESCRNLCQEIITASNSGRNLVAQLLEFTAAELPQSRSMVDFNELLSRSRTIIEKAFGKGIQVQINPAEHPLKTIINSSQIEQVIINLCLNARDAMPEGGKVTISAYLFFCNGEVARQYPDFNAGTYVCCEVADTGTGISYDIQPRIFEPFFTTRKDEKHSGLGLTSAMGIIRKHGGIINCSSEPGKGTVMRFYLPVAKEEEDDIYQQFVVNKEFFAAKNEETILMAEDDERIRKLGRDILESAQYQVIEAADGEEAIELFAKKSDQINLVLLDVVLPKKSGLEVSLAIEAINPGIPILFCSGYSEELIGHPEITSRLIIKPYQRNEILSRIKEELVKAENRRKKPGHTA